IVLSELARVLSSRYEVYDNPGETLNAHLDIWKHGFYVGAMRPLIVDPEIRLPPEVQQQVVRHIGQTLNNPISQYRDSLGNQLPGLPTELADHKCPGLISRSLFTSWNTDCG
ncbi:MAG: hypothetical protein K2Z81_14975, partial [Cyanobacteria bacterium]|nr:hypothetical protein [Cyanobacteriota bacterium]